MQDDQKQDSENNGISSDPLERSQKNVTAIEDANDNTDKKDVTSESKLEMCGGALLKMGEAKRRRMQKESQESSEEGITQ